MKKKPPSDLPFDMDDYRKYLDKFDMTEEQKRNLALAVWNFMEFFADRAFGLNRPPMKGLTDKKTDK